MAARSAAGGSSLLAGIPGLTRTYEPGEKEPTFAELLAACTSSAMHLEIHEAWLAGQAEPTLRIREQVNPTSIAQMSGVASDATFPRKRDHGAAGDTGRAHATLRTLMIAKQQVRAVRERRLAAGESPGDNLMRPLRRQRRVNRSLPVAPGRPPPAASGNPVTNQIQRLVISRDLARG